MNGDDALRIMADVGNGTTIAASRVNYDAAAKAFRKSVERELEAYREQYPKAVLDIPSELPPVDIKVEPPPKGGARANGPIREAGDDHFYGAWSGGPKSAGGKPMHRIDPKVQAEIDAEVAQDAAAREWTKARDDYLATLSGGDEGIRDWIATGDDVEARVYRLPIGQEPDLGDTLELWSTVTFGDIRAYTASGSLPDSQRITHTKEMANQLMREVAAGPKAPTLYRAIAVDESTAAKFAAMGSGGPVKLPMNLSSWSSSASIAASQGQEYIGGGSGNSVLVVFRATNARGLRLGTHLNDFSDEWITNGTFAVGGVTRKGNQMTVNLLHEGTFKSAGQMRGTQ